jgi:hypothetical protein
VPSTAVSDCSQKRVGKLAPMSNQGIRVILRYKCCFLLFLDISERMHLSNDFKDFYIHQIGLGKPKMKAIVATMGKMAEIIYHCLKTNEPYIYEKI